MKQKDYKKGYYSYLELNKNSTTSEIKKSYRQLILKWHPDKNNNSSEATEIFQEIQEAYEILGNATEKNLYDLNSHYYINTVKHNDNLKEISLKRFKQENIEKLRKELKSHPEINLDELGIHRNFEKNIKGCLRKDLVEEFHKRTSKYISEKKEEKLSLLKLQEIRKNSLSVLEKVIKDTEIKTWEINGSEYELIFSENCNCYLSMNYIRSYENHINKCLSKFNEVENFAVQLKKTLENKQNELSELRELRKFSINDIQKKLNEYLEKTGKNFSSKLLENWKEEVNELPKEILSSFKESIINEINKQLKNHLDKKESEKNSGEEIEETERNRTNHSTSEKNEPKTDSFPKDLEEIISILSIGKERKIDLNYKKIKEEIKLLKKENINFRLSEKRKELGEIKRNLIKKLDNEKEKDVLIKYFLNGHKDFLNNKDVWKHKRNMKTLEKSKLTKEEIQRIVSKQEEIFKLDFDSNKIEIEQYQSYQEQR